MAFAILAISVLFTLSACGFKPIYSPSNNVDDILKEVSISNISLSPQFRRMENEIMSMFAGDKDKASNWKLSININITKQSFNIQPDSFAKRRHIMMTMNYELKNKNHQISHKGVITAIDSFEIAVSPYSTIVSDEETQLSMARSITQELKDRIRAFVAKNR